MRNLQLHYSALVRGLALGALCVSAAAGLSACADERPAIDRVQPYALDKAFFVGEDLADPKDDPEFWTQATLVDVGYGAAQDGLFTSTYAQPMSRLKWQITEDLLIGRLAYERINGSDGKGIGEATRDGVVVAAFKIDKHFDIVSAYNPTTGEKLNIVEENTTDRPWNQRQYMRVDWSKNLNVDSYDFDTLSLLGVYGGITYEALSYYVEDPTDPDAPYFDDETGYFDVTVKAFAKPDVIDLSSLGWGIDSFPSCFLPGDFMGGTNPHGTCNPVELTIRHAFRRVVDNDYEPVHWDGRRFAAYGGFYVERYGYARNYGMSDSLWHRLLARYPIWERSHYYAEPETMTGPVECFTPATTPFGEDPHRDLDGNGTEDECEEVGPGSRCDTFKQRCTLPLQERTPKPIVWYYADGSHPEYYEPTADATHEWDVAMRVAVRSSQYAECVRVGDKDCGTRFPVYFGQQDDNGDAVALAQEVDDCRHGKAYADRNRDPAACKALASEIGKKRGYSAGVIAIAEMDEMIVLCHSPVEYGDPAQCGAQRLPEGLTAAQCDAARAAGDQETLETCRQALNVRRGDLRFHQVNVIKEPQTPSPWGIYTDAEDPLTGETVSASINVWSHVNDLWSQGVIDTMRYIKGELETHEITDGEYVRQWAEAAQAASSGGALPKMSRAQAAERMDRFARERFDEHPAEFDAEHEGHAHEAGAASFAQLNPAVFQKARALAKELEGVAATYTATSALRPKYHARRQAAAGTALEAELMTPMVQELHGIAGLPMTDGLLDLVSPLRGGNPSLQRDIFHLKENALAKRGACMLHQAPAPLSITGLADVLEEKFGAFNPADSKEVQQARAEKMRSYLARRAHFAVIAHEMGHSIGLRHNFVSSSDAWGYRPQYWQLRTRNGKVTQACTDLTPDGAGCIGPRYHDPVTPDEADNLIWMFMHSSVMDYAGELSQDTLGLGAYDFAAARMFYGDTVAVHADDSYKAGTPRGQGMISKTDSFGGILGIQPTIGEDNIHYSLLNKEYQLIRDCKVVKPGDFKPARWDDAADGEWHAVLDGHIVAVDGQPTRCRQQSVDYVPWTSLRMPQGNEIASFYRGGPAVDPDGRTRVPYGFATDGWADLGNLSVYRHDNGADPYELFDFLVAQQEVNHIFDNYRRGRQTFSVRSAAGRTLSRFNEKMRDGAKGLGLLKNIYSDFALDLGYDFEGLWPQLAPLLFGDNILASGLAFDHFVRTAARPEPGDHFFDASGEVLRSAEDVVGTPGETAVVIPNGATGYFGSIGLGGKVVENRLADDQGEYDRDYTLNAGSYYDKMYAAMLMTESVDNFISSSRTDFVDARYRAVSLADLFPDGYRRWLSNALTGDDFIKGPRVAADVSGMPLTDTEGYPAHAIGWTTWWGPTPEACFPGDGTTVCKSFAEPPTTWEPKTINDVAVLDPQIGWEQQKFLIAWTLLYLPENQQQGWMNMLRVWELGKDADPGFANRIEFHDPTGKIYVAKTFGSEVIFGKRVQRGIAARVLEYANELLAAAYECDDGPDLDGDGAPDWYLPRFNPTTGKPIVRWDPTIAALSPLGFELPNGVPGCNAQGNQNCTCTANRACLALSEYVEVPFFLRQALDAYRLASPQPKGIY